MRSRSPRRVVASGLFAPLDDTAREHAVADCVDGLAEMFAGGVDFASNAHAVVGAGVGHDAVSLFVRFGFVLFGFVLFGLVWIGLVWIAVVRSGSVI